MVPPAPVAYRRQAADEHTDTRVGYIRVRRTWSPPTDD
jgi:hypothetical protein